MSLSYRTMFRTAAMLCCCLLPAVSQGAYITSVSGLGSGWSITAPASVVTNTPNGGQSPALSGSSASTANSLALSLDALALHSPFTLRFNTQNEGASWDGFSRFYNLTLTIKNALAYPNAAHNFMNGFDFGNRIVADNTVALIRVNAATSAMGGNFSPGVFAFEQPTPLVPNISNGWRFGGLNGGGPTLAQNGTTVVKFQLVVTQNNPDSGLGSASFTSFGLVANPEPTTLLLGSLVMVPAGVALRRRRKAAAAEAVA